jgi:hypothetical protein
MKRRFSTAALVAAVLASVVVASGCGGGGDSTDTIPAAKATPLSKAEFIEQGDAICLKARKGAAEFLAEEELADPESANPEEFQAIENGITAILIGEYREVAALGLPKGEPERGEVEALAADFEAAAEQIESGGESGEDKVEKLDEAAKKFGFKACGG